MSDRAMFQYSVGERFAHLAEGRFSPRRTREAELEDALRAVLMTSHRCKRSQPESQYVADRAKKILGLNGSTRLLDEAKRADFVTTGKAPLTTLPTPLSGALVTPTAWAMRLRSTVAGWLFLLAGKLDAAYDVWLDDAPRREQT